MRRAMKYTIDLTGVSDKESLHERLRASLDLPDWYGGNLDAFYDILTEEGNFWDLVFVSCADPFREMPDYMVRFIQTLADAGDEMPGLSVAMML